MGHYRPLGSSPIHRQGERGVVAGVAVADLEVIEQNLEGLIMHVPDAIVDELHGHYQRHTMGVSASIDPLLRKVAREVTCYSEKHP